MGDVWETSVTVYLLFAVQLKHATILSTSTGNAFHTGDHNNGKDNAINENSVTNFQTTDFSETGKEELKPNQRNSDYEKKSEDNVHQRLRNNSCTNYKGI